MAAWMGGEFRGEWIHVCVWLNPLTVHLKLSQHLLISCIAIQNKKLKNNKKRSVSPPALFFFWIVLTVQGLLRFHMNFRMGFSISTKVIEIFYMDYIESVDCFSILSLESMSMTCVYVIFNFFHQCAVVFIVQVFNLCK